MSDTEKQTTPDPGQQGSSAERPGGGLEPAQQGEGAMSERRGPVVAGRARKGMFGVRGSGDTSGDRKSVV